MAPPILFDISDLDLNHVQYDVPAIEQVNPHRGAMRMLDGIHWVSEKWDAAVAFKDVRPDEFWVPGHVPGRPLLPGVLMIETAAQLASFVAIKRMSGVKFMGFLGADEVKFRGQVVPGDRLLVLIKERKLSNRRFNCSSQGWVNGSLVFEGIITGMSL